MSAPEINQLPLWVQDRDTVLDSSKSADIQWRNDTIPDYTRSNHNLATESVCNHLTGSLESIVQNLVRTFELEASCKTNPQQWLSVVQGKFRASTNGGKQLTAEELGKLGTYNAFMPDSEFYKSSEESFESSHKIFHSSFPKGFPWELLEVYSGPPVVTFKWRHWGHFNGAYKDFAPTGETIEIIGISVAKVTDDLKIIAIEHYFDNSQFLQRLTAGGKLDSSPDSTSSPANGCPFG